ncbi:MAG: HDIG domain-containing protein [Desulforhabdus sp.]|jgi:putative nucleotidyltransferase with HDIG domain|nr:HDIG domain-containing protein [Desulforhabdus sp.]
MEKERREGERARNKLKGLFGKKLFPVVLRETPTHKGILLAGFSLVIALLLTPSFTVNHPSYRLGDVADRNIKAKRDFLIEDKEATFNKLEEAVRQAPLVYDLDESTAGEVQSRIKAGFESMRAFLSVKNQTIPPPDRAVETQMPPDLPDSDDILEQKRTFEELLGLEISYETFSLFLSRSFNQQLEGLITQMLKTVFDQGIVANKTLLREAHDKDLIVRKLHSREDLVVPPPHSFPDVEEVRRTMRMQALDQVPDTNLSLAIAALGANLLVPNLAFNLSETEKFREQVRDAVKPVFLQVKKNEMLVREGQKIGPEELLRLKAYQQQRTTQHPSIIFFVIFMFGSLCIWVVAQVSRRHLPYSRVEMEDLLFLGVLLILLLTLARFTLWFSDLVGDSSGLLNGEMLIYAIPLTAGAMLTSIFFGVTISLIFSLVVTIFAGMLFGMDFWLFFYFLIGCFVAAHGATPCRNRMIPIKAGLLVGCANVVLIVLSAFLHEEWIFLRILMNAFFGFCGGVFSGILVTGLTPLAEIVFGYTTDIKLLELATMDQPLLQELMVQAPGTYHHSIIVGNMAEGAARSIGANSQLAKVSGYYHDIGKIKKPHYFIENQFDCQNPHQKLAPSMSSLILLSHVKEGVELAKKHQLGKSIIDIISQHHGTSFISYFYNKAMETREKSQTGKRSELPPINMDDYRYPGPKPQTKEAGLVMLADVVEAACRSLTDPTPARIKGMVNRLINGIFSDGQLEECELTLKDLHQIAKHFNKVLATVHHKRVEYPAMSASNGKAKTDASDSSQREPKQDKDRSSASKEVGRGDLKRLGLH